MGDAVPPDVYAAGWSAPEQYRIKAWTQEMGEQPLQQAQTPSSAFHQQFSPSPMIDPTFAQHGQLRSGPAAIPPVAGSGTTMLPSPSNVATNGLGFHHVGVGSNMFPVARAESSSLGASSAAPSAAVDASAGSSSAKADHNHNESSSGKEPGHRRSKKPACLFCKKRKLRCPDERPCRQCERRNIECIDDPHAKPRKMGAAVSAVGGKGKGAMNKVMGEYYDVVSKQDAAPATAAKGKEMEAHSRDGSSSSSEMHEGQQMHASAPEGGQQPMRMDRDGRKHSDHSPNTSAIRPPAAPSHLPEPLNIDAASWYSTLPPGSVTMTHTPSSRGSHASTLSFSSTNTPVSPSLSPSSSVLHSVTGSTASPTAALLNLIDLPSLLPHGRRRLQTMGYKREAEEMDFFDSGLRSFASHRTRDLQDERAIGPRAISVGHSGGVIQDANEILADVAATAARRNQALVNSGWTVVNTNSEREEDESHEDIIGEGYSLVREPDNRSARGELSWYDDLLQVFGPNRTQSSRIVSTLIEHFIRSHAIFVAQIIHTPTFLHSMADPNRRRNLHPALLPAILAVATTDIKLPRFEPYTADRSMMDAASQHLFWMLYQFAIAQLNRTIESGSRRDLTMAQATSVLALVSDSAEKAALMRVLEQTIRGNKWDAAVPELPGTSADVHADYYSRPWAPSRGASLTAEVEHENLIRICWTSCGHWSREWLHRPDEEAWMEPPAYLQKVAPIGTWDPSSLPPQLPEAFFRTQEIFRIGAIYMRLAHPIWSVPSDGSFDPHQVRWLSEQLDELESRIARVHSAEVVEGERPLRDELVRVVSRVMAPLRLSLWRKTGYWTRRPFEDYVIDLAELPPGPDGSYGMSSLVLQEDSEGRAQQHVTKTRSASESSSAPALKKTYVPPSISIWLEIIVTMCNELEKDSGIYQHDFLEQAQHDSPSAGSPLSEGSYSNRLAKQDFSGSRPALKACNLELSSAVSYVKALLQLHNVLHEGGTVLSLANRLLEGVVNQIHARDIYQAPYPADLPDQVEQARIQLEGMLLSDAGAINPALTSAANGSGPMSISAAAFVESAASNQPSITTSPLHFV